MLWSNTEHIRVLLVAIQLILAAVVERDHVTAQSLFVVRFFFDLVDLRAPRFFRRRVVHSGCTAPPMRAVTSSMLIRTLSLQVGALRFLGAGFARIRLPQNYFLSCSIFAGIRRPHDDWSSQSIRGTKDPDPPLSNRTEDFVRAPATPASAENDISPEEFLWADC